MPEAKRRWVRGKATLLLLGVSASLLGACSAPEGDPLGTSRAAATSFANDKPAYDYFVGKGLSNFQAAGIVGNLDQESGVDPTAVQSGGPGRGIAQWSVGGRWDTDQGDNLVAYAASQGQSTTSLTVQLDFLWFELQTFSDYGLQKLTATTNVTDATVAFETDFEGCSTCDEGTRIAYAEDVLKAYGSDPVPVDAGAAHDAALPKDAGEPDALTDSGLLPVETDDAGAVERVDAGSTSGGGAQAPAETSSASSGCAVAGPLSAGSSGATSCLALGLVLARALRRRPRPND